LTFETPGLDYNETEGNPGFQQLRILTQVKTFERLLCLGVGEGNPDDPVVGWVGHVEEPLLSVEDEVVLVLAAAHVQAQQLLPTTHPVKLPAHTANLTALFPSDQICFSITVLSQIFN
jgi:hypothetical protein